MSAMGRKIIDGLKDAVAGNFVRVTIEGQTWQRIDDLPDNPADEIDRLRAALDQFKQRFNDATGECARLRQALGKITKHPDTPGPVMQIACEALEGASPAPPPDAPVAPTGGRWMGWRHCPKCNADLTGEPIPERHREHYPPGDTHFSRVIGLYDRELDRTVGWRCPDCKSRVGRACTTRSGAPGWVTN